MIAAIVVLLAALLGGGHIEGAPAWPSSIVTTTTRRTTPLRATTWSSASPAISGSATWYEARGYVAAAGPALRQWLGTHWRGTRVIVTSRSGSVSLTLSDWCACGHGRLIDLSDDAFRELAPLSTGVIRVTITRAGPPHVHIELPATDTAP